MPTDRTAAKDAARQQVTAGDMIAWFRGGRYDCVIVGRVASLTPTGKYRIIVQSASRSDVRPGEHLVAERDRSVKIHEQGTR